jgi:hypothetical protein
MEVSDLRECVHVHSSSTVSDSITAYTSIYIALCIIPNHCIPLVVRQCLQVHLVLKLIYSRSEFILVDSSPI